MSGPVIFPTLEPECGDAEQRSLVKINALLSQVNNSLAALNKPGAGQVAFTNFIHGISFTIPAGADLLDVSVYNPNDIDCWVYVMVTPGAVQVGMGPTFLVRAYAHNHAYYEANVAAASVAAGQRFSIAVSATENTLTWANPVYLAIRHT